MALRRVTKMGEPVLRKKCKPEKMALRRVTKMGEPVLRKKCKPVTKFDEKLGQLLDDMADTMYEADGVGYKIR